MDEVAGKERYGDNNTRCDDFQVRVECITKFEWRAEQVSVWWTTTWRGVERTAPRRCAVAW